jgi:prophage regulatory protein|tara:strand:+ start:1091 stop:1327 length:237 start_codon:yes stop_codon:yes gene_type:complete
MSLIRTKELDMNEESRTQNDRILRPQEAADKLNISLASFYRRMKDPDFPNKIDLGPRTVGYFESDLDEWARSRQEHAA